MDNIKLFLDSLFNAGEMVCYSHNAYGTKIYKKEDVLKWRKFPEFFVVNPLHTKREDVNVTSFRNFLLESDGMTLKEQLDYVYLHNVPFCTAVYSGSKSIHWIIALDKTLDSKREYDEYAIRIHQALTKVDPKTKNASRFSRFPDAFRKDKNKTQKLLQVRSRITKEQLEAWLLAKGINPLPPPKPRRQLLDREKLVLRPSTESLLRFGANPGERNESVYKAAHDFCNCGYSSDEAFEYLSAAPLGSDFSDKELASAIRSAYKKNKNNSTGETI